MFKQKCALLFVTILYYAPKQGSSLALFDVMHYVILSCNGGIQDNTLGWPAWPQELPLHLTASFNIARLLNPSTFVLCLSSELSFKLGKNSSFFPLSRPFNAYLSYWIGLKKKTCIFVIWSLWTKYKKLTNIFSTLKNMIFKRAPSPPTYASVWNTLQLKNYF